MLRRAQLHSYQNDFIAHIKDGYESFGVVEVGLGKTVSVLTAVADLKLRTLVVAPKLVVQNVWPQEAAKWEHTQHLRVAGITGDDGPAYRKSVLVDRSWDVVCINYEQLPWLVDVFRRGELGDLFDMVVYDESDKMKSPGSSRFRKWRHRAHEFDARLAMTGTPASEGAAELWTQGYLLDPGLFGTSSEAFKKKFFEPADFRGWKWKPREGALDHITRKMSPYTFQALAADHLDLPEVVFDDRYFDLTPEARARYDKLERDLYLEIEHSSQLRAADWLDGDDEWDGDAEVDAANFAVLKNKLRQMCSGFAYFYADGDRQTVWHDGTKIQHYKDLRSELGEAQLMVCYGYEAEYQALKLKQRLGGKVPSSDKNKWIRQWNAGKLKTLGMHPASAGHGVNLQEGGAHHILFFSQPWSRRLFTQTIGRLQRMGQVNTVIVHRMIARNTVEEDVVAALASKGDMERLVLQGLARRA